MDFIDFCQHRRSIRSFTPAQVNQEVLVDMIMAASFAPSVGDLQPWEFIIVQDPAQREAIVAASHEQYWMQDAPVFIVVVANLERSRMYYGEDADTACRDSCVAALQNLLLAAHQRDLGACWVARMEYEALHTALGIPDSREVVACVAVGHPDGRNHLQPKDINPLKEFIFFESHGNRANDTTERLMDYGEVIRDKVSSIKYKAKQRAEYTKKKSRPMAKKFTDQLSEWVDRARKK